MGNRRWTRNRAERVSTEMFNDTQCFCIGCFRYVPPILAVSTADTTLSPPSIHSPFLPSACFSLSQSPHFSTAHSAHFNPLPEPTYFSPIHTAFHHLLHNLLPYILPIFISFAILFYTYWPHHNFCTWFQYSLLAVIPFTLFSCTYSLPLYSFPPAHTTYWHTFSTPVLHIFLAIIPSALLSYTYCPFCIPITLICFAILFCTCWHSLFTLFLLILATVIPSILLSCIYCSLLWKGLHKLQL